MRGIAAASAFVLGIGAAAFVLAQARADMVGHGAVVNALAVSPDGKQVLSASWDYTLKLWDLETQKELKSLDGHTASVNAVLFLPGGTTRSEERRVGKECRL